MADSTAAGHLHQPSLCGASEETQKAAAANRDVRLNVVAGRFSTPGLAMLRREKRAKTREP